MWPLFFSFLFHFSFLSHHFLSSVCKSVYSRETIPFDIYYFIVSRSFLPFTRLISPRCSSWWSWETGRSMMTEADNVNDSTRHELHNKRRGENLPYLPFTLNSVVKQVVHWRKRKKRIMMMTRWRWQWNDDNVMVAVVLVTTPKWRSWNSRGWVFERSPVFAFLLCSCYGHVFSPFTSVSSCCIHS